MRERKKKGEKRHSEVNAAVMLCVHTETKVHGQMVTLDRENNRQAVLLSLFFSRDRQAGRQANRQTDKNRYEGGPRDRQTDRQTGRQAGRQTDRQTKTNMKAGNETDR